MRCPHSPTIFANKVRSVTLMKSIITVASRATVRMPGRVAALAGFIAALVACAPALAEVTIVLRPQAEVTHPMVSLSDVAELTTSDLPTLRRLMAVPLGAAPPPGKVVSVSSASLQSWVRSRLRTTTPVQWSGAPRIEIGRAGPAVARGSFAAMVAHSGGVEVETRVEVLQDGQPGQRVRVRLITASTSILARVLASGRVEAIE